MVRSTLEDTTFIWSLAHNVTSDNPKFEGVLQDTWPVLQKEKKKVNTTTEELLLT